MGLLGSQAFSSVTRLGLKARGTKLQSPPMSYGSNVTRHSHLEPRNTPILESEKEQTTRQSLARWKWEIMGMILSLSSLAASIVLLAVYDGQRTDSWMAPFTLNTFISILAQTSRTSLAFGVGSSLGQAKWNNFSKRSGNLALFGAFDEASKGPWGSLNLLYRLRSWSFAIVGATVITTLLSYEPFVQASITLYGELDKELSSSGSTTSISRIERLDVGTVTIYDEQTFNPGVYMNRSVFPHGPDLGLLISAYRGVLSASDMATTLPHFSCPTGNCTFGNFASLGVCSSCVDVSSHLVKTQFGGPWGEIVYEVPWPNSELYIGQHNTLRNDTLIEKSGSPNPLPSQMVSTFYVEDTIAFNNIINSTTFFVMGILQPAPDYANNISTGIEAAPKATECGLHYCTNVYSSSVVEGKLNETLIASISNRDANSYQAAHRNASSVYEGWKPHALYQKLDYPRSDLQLFIPDKEAEFLGLVDGQVLRFNISQTTIHSAKASLATIFSELQPMVTVDVLQDSSAETVNIIAGSEDLNATFRILADSMSVYIRDQGYNSSARYGVSQTWVLHYRIRWEFLLLPLGLTLAGCFFLIYIIWETQSLGLMAWKESTLATLAHGLDALTRARMREAYLDNAEAKSAREISVKAERFRGGIELCEAHPSDVPGKA
ncbi:hypothetical protein F5X98DRAFT_348475 [Xylaria grammica]|nr:hypothetical protein F5X98DRAFT_348475 [Xylaria grammica]